MSYATVDELAAALEIRVTDENTDVLQACLDAATPEIDHILDGTDRRTRDDGQLVARVNINRAVEWCKAPATYNGGVGNTDAGTLVAPTSGFERHAAGHASRLEQSWGSREPARSPGQAGGRAGSRSPTTTPTCSAQAGRRHRAAGPHARLGRPCWILPPACNFGRHHVLITAVAARLMPGEGIAKLEKLVRYTLDKIAAQRGLGAGRA